MEQDKPIHTGTDVSKQKVAVKAMIWRRSDKGIEFLLLQLNQEEAHAQDRIGEWHFAGGVLEPGEGDVEAINREVVEETGLLPKSIRIAALIHEDEWEGYYEGVPGFHFVAKFYACEYIGSDTEFVLSREHDAADWFLIDEFPVGVPKETLRASQKFLNTLDQSTESHGG